MSASVKFRCPCLDWISVKFRCPCLDWISLPNCSFVDPAEMPGADLQCLGPKRIPNTSLLCKHLFHLLDFFHLWKILPTAFCFIVCNFRWISLHLWWISLLYCLQFSTCGGSVCNCPKAPFVLSLEWKAQFRIGLCLSGLKLSLDSIVLIS